MSRVRVKGFQIFVDRHGKPRCYHRKTRTAIDLQSAPLGSVEFFAECTRIAELTRVTRPQPGTLGRLIADYRAHPAFTDLAPRTRVDYQQVFDYLKPIADTPLVRFDQPLVVRIRDKAAASKGRKFANDVKARLSGSVQLGLRARLHWRERRGRHQRHSPQEGPAGRQQALERRRAGRGARGHAGPYEAGPRADDVHRARPEGRAHSPAQLLSPWRNRDEARQNGRAGILARAGPAGGHP